MQAAEETDSSTLRDGIEQLGVAEKAPGEDESAQEREDTGLATTTLDETKSESVKSMFYFISLIYTIAVESSLLTK